MCSRCIYKEYVDDRTAQMCNRKRGSRKGEEGRLNTPLYDADLTVLSLADFAHINTILSHFSSTIAR